MFLTVVIAAAASWSLHQHWMRLDYEGSAWRKLFWTWAIRGAAFPFLIWALANIGWGQRFPPLVPAIAEAQMAKHAWFSLWMASCFFGAVLIITWWTAISYIWILDLMARRAPNRAEFAFNVAFIGFFSLLCAAAFAYLHGVSGLGAGVVIACLPVVHFTMELAEKPRPRPMYDRAIAKLKLGKYSAAELEVLSQLDKCENDFDGWMMLAEIYARHFRNLEDAARVVLDICRDPKTEPVQLSVACHSLADWQLEAENAEAARAALELLCRKLPGTHFAHMARQRIAQLPRDSVELTERKKPKPIRLPSLREEPHARPDPGKPASRADAAREANRLSARLTDDPNDIVAREALARVLAEQLGKTALAIEQLKLLVELAEPGDEQKARWVAQIAAWQFESDKNTERFRAALKELIHEYPQSSQAFAAQRRLFLLEYELPAAPAATGGIHN